MKILAKQSRACCIYNILYLKPASNSKGYKCGGKWTCKKKRTVTPQRIISNTLHVYCVTQSMIFIFSREEDKNIFDYCRENNIEHITKAINSKKVDINITDEEVG